MKALDDIFEAHEKLVSLNKGTLEFGFSWKEEDGIIFYNLEQNIVCSCLPMMMKLILEHMPCFFCTDDEMLQVASTKFPNALVVIGATSFFQSKKLAYYFSEIVKKYQ